MLGYVRAFPAAMFSARNLWALVRGRSRLAAVFVTGGHFLGKTMMARRLRTRPLRARMQRLHVNSDWYILEPVDEHDRPVPPGELSHDVLVTNLANRIQPIIRYRMGDRVAISPESCSCGSPFPQIRVIGRTDDVLLFPTPEGGEIRILPLAISTVAEETPGVAGCQLIQRGPLKLTVRIGVENSGEEQVVWAALQRRLAAFLSAHGATTVTIEKAAEPPQLHPRNGKFRQVYSEVPPQAT